MIRSRRQANQGRRPPLDRFVDRITPIDLFDKALSSLDGSGRNILDFHGMSGQGKSLLIRKFIESLEKDRNSLHASYSLIDLSERTDRESWRLPVWIRNGLADQGIRFPAFDVGFELFWVEAFPEIPPPVLTHRWLQRLTSSTAAGAGDLATTIASEGLQHVIASVPFVGLAVARLGKLGLQWGAQKYLLMTNDALKELFYEGRLRSAVELEAHLPFLLNSDLDAYRTNHPDARFVVFIDEYERCLEHGGSSDLQRYSPFDSMVRDIATELRGTLFVIAGREPLRWAEIDPGWREILAGAQHKLGGLPAHDAKQLLAEEGITDSELQNIMIDNASAPEGPDDQEPVYPLLLDLQVQHWRNLVAMEREVDPTTLRIQSEEFEGRRTELLQRLLRDYEPPLRATLARLAVARWFDRPLFERIVRTFITGIQLDAFDVIDDLSFVRKNEGGATWNIHQGIRESLYAELSVEVKLATHRELIHYFESKIDLKDLKSIGPATIRNLREVLYHKEVTEPTTLVGWLTEIYEPLFDVNQYQILAEFGDRILRRVQEANCASEDDIYFILTVKVNALRNLYRTGEARECITRVIESLLEKNSALSQNELRLLSAYSNLLWSEKQFAEAASIGRKVLTSRETLLGPDHPDTLASLSNLGTDLHYLGRYEEAESLERRALKARERVLGPDDPDTLLSVANLAATLFRLKQHAEGETLDRRALEGRERVLGPNSLSTLTSVSNLGILLHELERYQEAELIKRRALEGRKLVLGPDDPDALDAEASLALTLSAIGRSAEAEALERHVMEVRERTLSRDHPETLDAVTNLAITLDILHRYEEEETLDRRIVEARERTLGSDDPDTLRALANLASTLDSLHRYEEEETLDRRIVEARERTLGSDHPDTLRALANLASTLDSLHRYEEEESLQKRVVEAYERVLGPDHVDTLNSIGNLGSTIFNGGRIEEAEPLLRRALEGLGRIAGPSHIDTALCQSNLSELLNSNGSYSEAKELAQLALAVQEKELGLTAPKTLLSARNLAAALSGCGSYKEAEPLAIRSFEGLRNRPAYDREFVLAAKVLAGILYALGKHEEAAEVLDGGKGAVVRSGEAASMTTSN
jgi:tetratricopeptide (TPR) repeat protein